MFSSRRRFVRHALLGSASMAVLGTSAFMHTGAAAATDASVTEDNACNSLLSHALRPLMGSERRPLCEQFADKVLLIVNTASKCGFTSQFEGLEKLHQRFSDDGLQVLGFPSGDFRQELTSEEEVAKFCELNYGVTFPMFEKIHVTGDKAHPLYRELADVTGSFPKWNFNKYLINREGVAVAHYNSSTKPMGKKMVSDIEALL